MKESTIARIGAWITFAIGFGLIVFMLVLRTDIHGHLVPSGLRYLGCLYGIGIIVGSLTINFVATLLKRMGK
jgi:hypothetical protein